MPHDHQQYFLALLADGFHKDLDILDIWYAQITFSSHKELGKNPSML